MIYKSQKEEIIELVIRQLNSFFPQLSKEEIHSLNAIREIVLEKCEYNFSQSANKYFHSETENGQVTIFDPCHSIQWMTFLYYLSHELYLQKSNLCDRVYYLNKILHSVDLFYAIELPNIWSAEHPLATVMGRAKYNDGFFFYQGCTVGGNHGNYPSIGINCTMYANSSIIGDSHIGDNVSLGAGCLIKDCDIPSNSVVFGQSPDLIIKQKKNGEQSLYFKG